MGRVGNSVRFMVRWFPWVATGAAAAYRRLPEKYQEDINDVAKEPGKWGQAIEKTWEK